MSADSVAGLRRLALHARDMLAPHALPIAIGRSALHAEAVNAHAACVLAHQVLTLLADCIDVDGADDDEVIEVDTDPEAFR